MNQAIIGIGSNIDPQRNVAAAIAAIEKSLCVIAKSHFVSTAPLGNTHQADFLNGAVLIETTMEYEQLRAWLHETESDLGRVRTADMNGPRTIDLDVLVWNGKTVDGDVHTREFLRNAVKELLPGLSLL